MQADGQEELLHQLKDSAAAYHEALQEEIEAQWRSRPGPGCYLVKDGECASQDADDLHFIFTGIDALDRVRFPSFVRDCRALERPASEYIEALAVASAQVADWVRAEHSRLRAQFDPHVVKLRPKHRLRINKSISIIE